MLFWWHMKWNEWVFRPHLCTYRLNWVRRTSWGLWYEWDNTSPTLQIHNSNFAPWLSEAEHVTSRSRPEVSPQYWILRVSKEETFRSLKLECQSEGRTRDLLFSKQAASTTAPGPPPLLRISAKFTESNEFTKKRVNLYQIVECGGADRTNYIKKFKCWDIYRGG